VEQRSLQGSVFEQVKCRLV
jgi:hypothetical protein